MHAPCHVKTFVLVVPSFTLKMAATKDITEYKLVVLGHGAGKSALIIRFIQV